MRSRLRPVIALLSLILMVCSASPAIADQNPEATLVDRTHQGISESLAAPARWFDNFFRDPRLDEEPAGTLLRLRGSVIAEDGEKLSFKGKVKARLKLPNLKRRFHLILSSEDEDLRDETLKDARVTRESAGQEETSLALQYTQNRTAKFSLAHRFKVDLEDELNPQLRSRMRYTIPIVEQSLLTLAQAVFWENEEGFGEESRIDYDLPLSDSTLVRVTGKGLFSETSNGYEWLTLAQWLQSFSHKKALAVGSYVAGETRPQNHVTEYDLFVKYRQQIVKKWLFIELKPELKWPRVKNFDTTGIFTLTLEIQFED
jgi:hypothetical protein